MSVYIYLNVHMYQYVQMRSEFKATKCHVLETCLLSCLIHLWPICTEGDIWHVLRWTLACDLWPMTCVAVTNDMCCGDPWHVLLWPMTCVAVTHDMCGGDPWHVVLWTLACDLWPMIWQMSFNVVLIFITRVKKKLSLWFYCSVVCVLA